MAKSPEAPAGRNSTEGETSKLPLPRQRHAELVWDGKYDAKGSRVAPLRVSLPFQTVETVNESAQDRQRNLFTSGFRDEEWRNRLIWGDKKYMFETKTQFEYISSLNSDERRAVKLI